MKQKVFILLPAHNRVAVTACFIDCLVAQTYSNYHLVLIDDGSVDGTAEMVQSKIKNLTVLTGQGDWWWAGSLQQGINWLGQSEATDRDIVIFANDDTTFNAEFLQKAVTMLNDLDATLLLPYLRDDKTGMLQETGVEADLRKHTFDPAISPERINCLPTRDLFLRVADLRKIGGFYPWLLPHYWSDYEFTIRAYRKGLKLCTRNNLVISLDSSQTGYRSFEGKNFSVFLRQYFSKKSVLNPVYHTSFVLLTSPWSSWLITVLKIWRNAFIYVTRRLIHSLKM